MEKFAAVSKSIACARFIERLKYFKYIDWKAIDPTKLEYVSLGSKPFIPYDKFSYYCLIICLR
jgi:hypothetical protein